MKLLVSVRDPREVEAALEGGADIIDAKDPARGPLGAVEPATLARVLERVPAATPFSAALGDPPDAASAAALIAALPIPLRRGPVYAKLGFASIENDACAERMLRVAVEAARRHPARPLVIAVAYADAAAHQVRPEGIASLARCCGAGGVLLDTLGKSGGSLLDLYPVAALHVWVAGAGGLGRLVALAGSLDRRELELVASSGADIAGVRGAACEGGREGRVSAGRVRHLREALTAIAEDRDPAAKHQSTRTPRLRHNVRN